ncbi:zinc-binding dehydrogenase [Nostoc sp. CHAB 5834]|nr:zinc-binding dehydrogenase [Nostoc sp. CHAB 5834]
MESSKITIVIDSTYPLQELAAAHGCSKSESAVGKLHTRNPHFDKLSDHRRHPG